MRTHIDLFSGIGGFALACRWAGIKTVAFCEIDPFCQKVLEKNFDARLFTNADKQAESALRFDAVSGSGMQELEERPRLYGDIRNFNGRDYAGAFILTGGFPCQPFSCAGKRRGKEDDRHLWPEMLRVISEARPTWVIGENVAGIVKMELDNCISDLEGISYSVQAFIIPACAVDAPHRRDRVWIVAESSSATSRRERRLPDVGGDERREDSRTKQAGLHSIRPENAGHIGQGGQDVADAERNSIWTGQCEEGSGRLGRGRSGDFSRWLPEPSVGRVAHGVPKRVDRLKSLGNAIVPQVAFEIIRAIAEVSHD